MLSTDCHTLPLHEARRSWGGYACAGVRTEGEGELVGAKADGMDATLAELREAGATVEETKAGIRVAMSGRAEPVTLSTAPYPGFATDMQAQFEAMATLGKGASLFTGKIFEKDRTSVV